MTYLLFLLLFVLPFIEIWLLFQLSETLPLLSIFGICGITGGFGLWLIRGENLSLWTFFETEIQNKRIPTDELIEAILIFTSGITLLIPGLITDGIGFTLIFPAIREWLTPQIRSYILKKYF